MKNKLIGILVCMLLIATAIPVIGQVKNISIIKNENEINPRNNGDKWIKTYGGLLWDEGKMVQLTNDGCYIVAGETCIEPANPPDYYGDWDYWLIKIDAMGNKIWDKTFSLYGYDKCSAVRQTTDDGFILVGTSQKSVYPWDDEAVWLIKTDKDGVKEWDKTYFEGNYSDETDVIQTSDGGYAIISYAGSSEIYIIRTDDTGDIIWDKKMIGLYINDYGDIIKQTLDGGFIIVGSKDSLAGVLLIKLDNDGNILWEKTFVKGKDNHIAYSMQTTNDGGFIICGHLEQPDSTWIIKTDSEGELIWDIRIGTHLNDIVSFSVQQTFDNGYIIAGRTDPLFLDYDPVLIKTDSEGQVEWRKTFDYFLSSSMVNSVQQTTDGGYIAVGTVNCRNPFSNILLIKTDSEGNVAGNRVITNSFLIRLLERFPHMFPILRHLLRL